MWIAGGPDARGVAGRDALQRSRRACGPPRWATSRSRTPGFRDSSARIAGTPPAAWTSCMCHCRVPSHAGEILARCRYACGHVVEPAERVVDPRLPRERQHVQHGIGGPAHRDVERDGVVDRGRGQDVEEASRPRAEGAGRAAPRTARVRGAPATPRGRCRCREARRPMPRTGSSSSSP